MQDRGRGVARVHVHARNVPSYKEGNHLHRPYHFPPNPLATASSSFPPPASSRSPALPPPHRLALPHRILFLTFIASICQMADAHGDTGAAARDVVELQGQGADVGGVHGGAGKLATAADVAGSASSLQKVMASSGAVHPDAPVAPPALEEQEDDGRGKRRKIDYTFDDPYDSAYGDDEEYEYVSGKMWMWTAATLPPSKRRKRRRSGSRAWITTTRARPKLGAAPTAPPSQSQSPVASFTF
ncbi:hypothetical protein ACQJBY_024033 [Aegilops geniculata]